VSLDEGQERRFRLLDPVMGFHRVDGSFRHELAGPVHDRDLAAGAEARIHAHHHLVAARRQHQQIAQILLEYEDGLVIRLALDLEQQFEGDGRQHQAAVSIHQRLGQQGSEVGLRVGDPEFPQHFEDAFIGARQLDAEHPLLLAPPHGQEAVRRHRAERFAVVVVHLELGAFLGGVLLEPGGDQALGGVDPAGELAIVGVFRDVFSQDVLGALQRVLDIVHAARLAQVGRADGGDVGLRIAVDADEGGQRLQTLFPGDGGARAPLGPVGEVEVLQLLLLHAAEDLVLELRSELAGLVNGLENRLFPLFEFSQILVAVAHRLNLDLVHLAGFFLAVPRDERDGAPFVDELDGVFDLERLQLVELGDQVVHNACFHTFKPVV